MVVRNGRILASQCWIRLQLVSFDQRHSGGLTSPGRRDLRLSSRRRRSGELDEHQVVAASRPCAATIGMGRWRSAVHV